MWLSSKAHGSNTTRAQPSCPADQDGPGKQELLGDFNIDTEIAFFLGEAMKSAKVVGDKYVNNLVVNTDAPEGMTAGFTEANPYYCMFSADNSGEYSEVLLYRAYNLSLSGGIQIQAQFQKNAMVPVGHVAWSTPS